MSSVKTIVLGSVMMLALAGGACDGCSENYYCDETGCYWCDSYGCREVEPPDPILCRGDWECPADRPFCSTAGCVAQCEADGDCPSGLDCVDGLCVEPGTVDRPPMRPGYCGDDATVCAGDEYCAPSRCCLPAGGDNCCADIDCAGGEICDLGLHVCVMPPADAGTDDGGPLPDGGTDGPPIPEPQCRSNAQCEAHYLCIDGVCKLPCRSDVECGAGCHCEGGFCSEPTA